MESADSRCLGLGTVFRQPECALYFVGDCTCLSVSHQIGCISFTRLLFLYFQLFHVPHYSSLKVMSNLHAAFRSDSLQTTDEVHYTHYNIKPPHYNIKPPQQTIILNHHPTDYNI